MKLLEGQTKNAEKCKELREKIPANLKAYIDVRPKKTGMELVSFFDFAPMRGISVGTNKAVEILSNLKEKALFLVSSNKTPSEKNKILKGLGFKNREKKSPSGYLEEDVQAYIIRELLGGVEKNIIRSIEQNFGFTKLRYLTSELQWSLDRNKGRVDILCYDEDSKQILVLEIKKERLTNLEQARYFTTLSEKENNDELAKFLYALTGSDYTQVGKLDLHMVYVMPDNPNKSDESWQNELKKETNTNVDGIIFYQTGFSVTRPIKR